MNYAPETIKREQSFKINTYNHELEIDYHTVVETKQDDQYRKNMLNALKMLKNSWRG